MSIKSIKDDEYVYFHGVNTEKETSELSEPDVTDEMVVSLSSHKKPFLQLMSSISNSECVLIEGESGCGKTFMLDLLAKLCHKYDTVVTIHLGDQIDSKTLLGTFTCSDMPGEFIWAPGILTKAVVNGQWIVLEDLDFAPDDVISLLIPLVKTSRLIVPGYTEPFIPAKGFKIFVTRRLSKSGIKPGYAPGGRMLSVLEKHLTRLHVPQYTREEMIQISLTLCPDLDPSFITIASATSFAEIDVTLRKLVRLARRLSHVHRSAVSDVMINFMDVFLGHLAIDDCYRIALDFREVCGRLSIDKLKHLCYEYQRSPQSILSTDYNNRFAHTRSSISLLDKVETCVQLEEPVLLVGETGVGKTAVISYLAAKFGKKLISINLSQQTDTTDLLGGFKPVKVSHLIVPLKESFKLLLKETFRSKKIIKSLNRLNAYVDDENWRGLTDFILHSIKFLKETSEGFTKHVINKAESEFLSTKWEELRHKVLELKRHLDLPQANFAFDFIEGGLVEAVRKGWWVLLDEVNLASPEALQCLSGLLEGPQGTFVLTEKVDSGPVVRDTGFRLFSCMNPATDINKRSLPINIRNRFSEFYVDDVTDRGELRELIKTYLPHCEMKLTDGIINFYLKMREKAKSELHDGTGRRPHYSLRTLCRSLQYDVKNPSKRSLYEGLLLSFYSQLCQDDHLIVSIIAKKCLDLSESCVTSPLPRPLGVECVQVEGYWLPVGSEAIIKPTDYILTPSINTNLTNLARVISGSTYPILLQGPTSAGKTSLVQYLAKVTGHRCLRINNHEHTDLQEYIGMYSTSVKGTLEFNEGVLVKAMKEGYWIILDELNLAPSDVLEALNRVLDDNRELYIPETQQLIKAHPHFRLIGTQNPPGVYGGRKLLSRAFRNRFIELHYDDIPPSELVEILYNKCSLPKSYAEKMVAVMKDLQQRRSVTGIFEGKYGLITLRDLFRWAERYRRSSSQEKFFDWEQLLAEDGFMLLAGRLRTSQEEKVIIEVIQKYFKKSSINPLSLFNLPGGLATRDSLKLLTAPLPEQFKHLVWTPLLLRMAVLVHRAVLFDEPVLLVGTTGCGKTTLCQLIASLMNRPFYSINCHMHSEAGDFLGGLRPVRNRNNNEGHEVKDMWALFEWCDGMLVKAMENGGCVLIDEISLADDAVLERLNSVLEPERRLLVAEKGTGGVSHLNDVYEITAKDGFLFLATMNPGGDYGKKELSPALRNRFLEIWCPDTTNEEDYKLIIDHNVKRELKGLAPWSRLMIEFISWIKKQMSSTRFTITVRDILLWVNFMNTTSPPLSPSRAFINGAEMIFIDSLGCGLSCNYNDLKNSCLTMLKSLCELDKEEEMEEEQDKEDNLFGIHPFYIERGTHNDSVTNYCFTAQGPSTNLFRLLRGLQLGRPLLLEGDPGVGKTSLVSAIAASSGHALTRINLSQHTDISDLFGSDLPVEGKQGVRFEWRDGPFLKALRNAEWILLDEMNLASQSVLEGLNACLDHRGEIYIPELSKTFSVPYGTRLFACQNPFSQGGGRKGLPRSFVNRFTQVYMEPMSYDDLVFITCSLYPQLSESVVKGMVFFNCQVQQYCDSNQTLWEFNLRDILRWCEIMKKNDYWSPGYWFKHFYTHRLRNNDTREKVISLYKKCMPDSDFPLGGLFYLFHDMLQIGATIVDRGLYREGVTDWIRTNPLFLLPCQVPLLEALLHNVLMNWMTILVGPGNSGKSSLVHILAALTGNRLLEYHMNSNTDTMELLGGYEQVNYKRRFSNLLSRCVYMISCLKSEGTEMDDELSRTLSVLKSLLPTVTTESINGEEATLTLSCRKLKGILEAVNSKMSSSLSTDLEELLFDIDNLLMTLTDSTATCGQFEWVDSLLVTALTQGYWLVITQANFCSPSVLDRLNPLLEPNGSLSVDERGAVNGYIPTVKPHKNFRLFLTMDAAHGEVSRAMRNRGIEIALLPQDVEALHLQLSTLQTTFFLNLRDLLFNPVISQVERDIQPLMLLVNSSSDLTDINVLLQVMAKTRLFIDLASVHDVYERYEALIELSNQQGSKSSLYFILMAMADILVDKDYVAFSTSIVAEVESIIGSRYNSYINIKINSPFYERIQKSLSSQLDHLNQFVELKFLMYIQKRVSSSWSILPYLSNSNTAITLNKFLTHFTSLLSITVAAENDFTMSSLAVDSLKLLIFCCHFTGGSVSTLAISWYFFKQYCFNTLPDRVSNNNVLSLFASLSSLDKLYSSSERAIQYFRKVIDCPSPPQSDLQIEIMSILRCCEKSLVSFAVPPLHIMDPFDYKRKQLLRLVSSCSNEMECLQKVKEFVPSSLLPSDSSQLLTLLVKPALISLKMLYLDLISKHQLDAKTIEESQAAALNYCTKIPQWPLESLICVANVSSELINEKFSNWLELLCTDIHLHSLCSLPVTYIESLTDLSFSCLLSCDEHDNESFVITIENHVQKRNELQLLLQFLLIHGLDCSQELMQVNQDITLVKRYLIKIVQCLSLALQTEYGISDINGTTLSQQLVSLQEICASVLKEYQDKWNDIFSLLLLSCGVIEYIPDSVVSVSGSIKMNIGRAKAYLGMALVLLLSPTSPLDPVVMENCLSGYSNLLVIMNKYYVQSFNGYIKETVGHYFDHSVPYTSSIYKTVDLWTNSLPNLQHSPPERLHPENYERIIEDSRDLLKSLCDTNRVKHLIENGASGEVEVWLNSIYSVMSRYRENYPSYCDLIQPVNGAFSLLSSGVKDVSMIANIGESKDNLLDQCVTCLVQFPYTNDLFGIGELGRIKHLLSLCGHDALEHNWKIRLSLVAVAVECSLHIVSCIPHVIPMVFKGLMSLCYNIWKKADEKERERKKEEESLYHFKVQTCDITGDEGHKEKNEMESTFPSFESFFTSENNESSSKANTNLEESDCTQFTDEQMRMITCLHSYLYYSSGLPDSNYHLRAYKTAKKLYTKLSNVRENDCIGGHAKACYFLLQDVKHNKQNFNIYRDPLVIETNRALVILEQLKSRVNEILEEWPDYPSLLQIIFACGQVLALDLQSPLMKVLVGMENVLRKSQDWEAYSCSSLSLSKELEAITGIILEWRRLELNGWSQLLDICKNDIVTQSSKWWFYINGLILDEDQSLTLHKLIRCLLSFMEGSSLGEYSTRLKIVKAFGQQSLLKERHSSLGHAMESVYCYYQQFEELISEKISLLCSPVEKAFKDYLSIVRWKDGNYWSIKQQSERSHRTLMHHMTQYKDILMQPVRPLLYTSSVNAVENNDISKFGKIIEYLQSRECLNICNFAEEKLKFTVALDTHINLPGLECYKRINILLADYKSRHFLLSYCQQLDEFTGDVINEYHALQSDDIKSESVSKGEHETAVKLILMKRKRAFTQLFKSLKLMGLSYRKGADLSSEDLHMSSFTTPCFLEKPSFESSSSNISLIDDCNFYFFRTVFRATELNTAMGSPSKELNVTHITWIKGYSQELLSSLISQRCALVDGLHDVVTLKHIIDRIKVSEKHTTINTLTIDHYLIWMDDLLTLLNESLEALQYCQELLNLFPESLDLCLTPRSPSLLPPIISSGTIECFKQAMDNFNEWKVQLCNVLKSVIDLSTELRTNNFYFLTKKEINLLISGYNLIHTFADCAIEQFLSDTLGDHKNDTSILKFLVFLQQKINDKCSDFKSWTDEINTGVSNSQFDQIKLETIVKSLLLDIQHVMEREKCLQGIEKDCDQPVYKLASDFSYQNVLYIKCKEVTSYLTSLVANSEGITTVIMILPLLDQYLSFVKRMWLELAVTHRTVAKLTSCLLQIFINLILKGFCTPPDLMDLNENEEFIDQEAGGFDEGDGNKNVSDNVEKDNLDAGGTCSEECNEEKGDDSEKNGVEMEEDFAGSLEDLPDTKGDEDEEENDKDDGELDKQMGKIGDGNTEQKEDQLDKNMWAPEEEEKDSELNKESGGGTTADKEMQLVAKDDSSHDEETGKGKSHKGDCEDGEELVNDQDDYFKAGQDPQEKNDEENGDEDFGDINIDDCKEGPNEEEEGNDDQMETLEGQEFDSEMIGEEENMEVEDEGGREGESEAVDNNDEENHSSELGDSTTYNDAGMQYGVPQTTLNEDSSKQNTCNTEETSKSDDHCGLEQPISSSGTFTTILNIQGSTVTPQANCEVHKEEKNQGSSSKPESHSRSDDPPAKRLRLMNTNVFDNNKESLLSEDKKELTNSNLYQHVSNDESCDASAWDSISGVESTGHQPIADRELDEGDEQIKFLVSEECQLNVESRHDNEVIHMKEEEEKEMIDQVNQMETEKVPVIPEKTKPTDSFFNSTSVSWQQSGQLDEDKLRGTLRNTIKTIHSTNTSQDCNQLWLHYEQLTSSLSNSLCEELRLILKPTETSQLKGDFRNGKRLNLRRIIPYIASNFQNDRIWLKRCKPNKRNYQILLAVDDSSSMNDNECTQMAFESLAMMSTALQKLECGQLGVCRFGNEVEVLHSFNQPLLNTQGGYILQNLSFSQTKTNYVKLLQCAQILFNQSAIQGKNVAVDVSQLMIILSDGRGVFADGTKPINMGVQELTEMGVFIVFVILDGLGKHSIVDIPSVKFISGKAPVTRTYLETFPFPYYIVLREISALPAVLCQALRQWFELIAMST